MNKPQRFRKKPVEIEAMRCEDFDAVIEWANQDGKKNIVPGERWASLKVHTMEGMMTAHHGDWIIRGVKGEFYPCKPDIFEATYEQVGESSPVADLLELAEEAISYAPQWAREKHQLNEQLAELEAALVGAGGLR